MAKNFSDTELSSLFTMTWLFTLMLIPLYGLACSRIRLSTLLPAVYAFFALNLVGFYFAYDLAPGSKATGAVFYVWISVFNLFVVSVFWSFMADIFNEEHRSGCSPLSRPGQAWAPLPAPQSRSSSSARSALPIFS